MTKPLDVEKEVRKMARDLLKRHPTRRGPYLFDDDELRRIGYSSSARQEKP